MRNKEIDFYKRVIKHLSIILLLIALPSLWFYFMDQSMLQGDISNPFFFLLFQSATGVLIFLLPPVYLIIYALVPFLLIRKKYLAFILVILALILIWGYFISYAEPWTDEHWFGMPAVTRNPKDGFIAVGFLVLLTTLINLSYRWFVQQTRIRQMENDHLKKELSLLKNQINPHFLFNTLNNLYALALEESEHTPQVILKLSELMRYAVYECKEPFVSIEKEVNYLENYLLLQEIRQDEGSQIHFVKKIQYTDVTIAPMILIVLLENAFKHGVESMPEGAYVRAELQVEETHIYFVVHNNYREIDRTESGGMGLENVRKRLDLIYGSSYDLSTQDTKGSFTAELKIEL